MALIQKKGEGLAILTIGYNQYLLRIEDAQRAQIAMDGMLKVENVYVGETYSHIRKQEPPNVSVTTVVPSLVLDTRMLPDGQTYIQDMKNRREIVGASNFIMLSPAEWLEAQQGVPR